MTMTQEELKQITSQRESGDEEADDIKDRWHDAHLDLEPFHRQYQQVKTLMDSAKSETKM